MMSSPSPPSPRLEVIDSYSPLSSFHPTSATIRDEDTGETYRWNSRSHRKLRHPENTNPAKRRRLPHLRLWCFEPHVVTWYLNVTNIVANVLWTVSGVFATWPNRGRRYAAGDEDAAGRTVYWTGIAAGIFMVVSCYLTYVEAINQSHSDIVLPPTASIRNGHGDDSTTTAVDSTRCGRGQRRRQKNRRRFVRPGKFYGYNKSPIRYRNHGFDAKKARRKLEEMGFPYVEAYGTGKLVTSEDYERSILASKEYRDFQREKEKQREEESGSGDEEDPEMEKATGKGGGDGYDEEGATETGSRYRNRGRGGTVGGGGGGNDDDDDDEARSLVGRKVNVREGRIVVTTAILDVHLAPADDDGRRKSYEWWTWNPSLDHLGVLTSLIGFVSALVYLIPMCAGYPLSNDDGIGVGTTVFVVYVLQVLPYMCFAAVGHMLVAEAAGSWWRPKLDSLGYWAATFNYVGAWGFLLCGALGIPGAVDETCCPNMGKWGSAFACFWGSVSYLVGGVFMWIEFANPELVNLFGDNRDEKSSQSDGDDESGKTQ